MDFEIKEVAINKLKTENLQIRVEMLEECVEDYAEKYREDPKALPPVVVFYDFAVDEYYLADGFHRVVAAKCAERDKISAEVHEGTRFDALKFALSANNKHGLRRTNADKRNAMLIAWANRKQVFGTIHPTERQLATICSVSAGNAHNFMTNKGLLKMSKLLTPLQSDDADGSTVLSSALAATRDHLEERNESVRALLAEGKDRYGVTIPECIKPAFNLCKSREIIRDLGTQRKVLEEHRLAGDIAFAHSISYALRDLDATIRDLRQGVAHCVCRMCRGTGCASCSDLGFQTKLQYDMVPSEYKAERKRK